MRRAMMWIGASALWGLARDASAAGPDARPDGDPPAWVCVRPEPEPFEICARETSASVEDHRRCLAYRATLTPVAPRWRIDQGPWLDFPASGWRCARLPEHGGRFQLENYGRPKSSWRVRRDPKCAHQVYDLSRQNNYLALWTKCSRRSDHGQDERLP